MSTATLRPVPSSEATEIPSEDAATLRATVPQTDLALALRWARHAVTNRPPVAILGGLLLTAERGVLTVHGYDYETASTSTTLAPGASGQAVVEARMLTDVVKAIGRRVDIRLEATEPGRLLVAGGGVEYHLATLPVSEYPQLHRDVAGADHVASMSGQDLVDLARARVAAGDDYTTPVLTTVAFDTHDGRLRAAATDRYRCVVTHGPVGDTGGELLVPAKVLRLVAQQFRKEPVVTIGRVDDDPPRVVFSAGSRTMSTACNPGPYPKVHGLFPTGEPTVEIDVNREDLALAVHQVGMVAERNTPVTLTPVEDGVRLTAGHDDFASAAKTVAAEVTGDRPVAVNPGFLLDLLRAFPGDRVCLSQTVQGKPVILTVPGQDDIRALLMPVRLAG